MMPGGMMDQNAIEWRPTCDKDGCIGVRLPASPKCLAHASDEQRNATLKRFGETGEIDARGVSITQGLLEQILAAGTAQRGRPPDLHGSRFSGGDLPGRRPVQQGDLLGRRQLRRGDLPGRRPVQRRKV